jgi:hypothetical protein
LIPTRPVHHLPWGWTPAESRLSQLDPSSWPGQGPAWWLSSSDLAPSHASGSSWAEWERGWSLAAGPGLSPPGGVEGHWDGGQVIPKTQNEKKTRAGAAPSADWGGGVNPDLPLPFFSLGEQSQMGHAHDSQDAQDSTGPQPRWAVPASYAIYTFTVGSRGLSRPRAPGSTAPRRHGQESQEDTGQAAHGCISWSAARPGEAGGRSPLLRLGPALRAQMRRLSPRPTSLLLVPDTSTEKGLEEGRWSLPLGRSKAGSGLGSCPAAPAGRTRGL